MIYCCEDCGFLFRRVSEVAECPLCEGTHFRPATEEETKQLQTMLDKETQTRKGERT